MLDLPPFINRPAPVRGEVLRTRRVPLLIEAVCLISMIWCGLAVASVALGLVH
jgi:hypothetical protein